jgi:hypothetical protein
MFARREVGRSHDRHDVIHSKHLRFELCRGLMLKSGAAFNPSSAAQKTRLINGGESHHSCSVVLPTAMALLVLATVIGGGATGALDGDRKPCL